jgi:hypothetical protein
MTALTRVNAKTRLGMRGFDRNGITGLQVLFQVEMPRERITSNLPTYNLQI